MLSRWIPQEKPLVEVEEQIEELKQLAAQEDLDLSEKISQLEARKYALMEDIFSSLSPWDRVQMARHPSRPYPLDYVNALCSEWVELHGDRAYADDGAVIAGLARYKKQPIVVVGNQKGRDTKERQARNFGQPSPEGLRKGMRVMKLAGRFGNPVLSFIDTPGAACSPDAEERGISEAIAKSQWLMSTLPVPIIAIIIGEGCSGGAIATGLGDVVMMLENSYYSVISPEGCASILYRDPAKAPESAAALGITADDALRLGIVDEVLKEPLGGAHRDMSAMCQIMDEAIDRHLKRLQKLSPEELVEQRYERFRRLGEVVENIENELQQPSSSDEEGTKAATT